MRRMGPGTRFSISIVLVTLAFILLAGALAFRSYENERDSRIEETATLAMNAGLNADRFLRDRLDLLTTIAAAPVVRAGDIAAMSDYFELVDPVRLGFVGGIGWTDTSGVVRVSTSLALDDLPIDVSDRSYVSFVLTNQAPYVAEAVVGRLEQKPLLAMAVPTFDERLVLNGVLIGSIRLDLLADATKEQRFGTTAVTILDRQGNIIAQPDGVTELVNVTGSPLLEEIGSSDSGVLKNVTGITGESNRIVSYAHAPSGGWTILIDLPGQDLIGPARRTLIQELLGLAVVGIAVAGGAIWIGRGINHAAQREASALDELAVRESRLRALTEATTQVTWTADAAGRLHAPEERWSALTGAEPGDLDGSEWLAYVHPEDREPGNAIWQERIASGSMAEFEQRVRRPKGEMRSFLLRAVPVCDSEGTVREWIGVDIDVTDQRQAENALRAREYFAREVIDSLIAFVGVMSVDGTLITVNRAALTVSGVPESELLNRPLWKIYAFTFDQENQERLQEAIARAAAGEFVRYDAMARLGDGRMITIDIAIGAIRGDGDQISYLVASAIDVTERTLAQHLVAASEERYRALVEATSTVVWRTSPDGNAFFVGDSWAEITGQTVNEMAGSGWLDVIHPDDVERTITTWRRSVESRSIHEDEFRVRVRDGSYRYFSARGVPVFDEDGNVREWVGANTDIHDRKRAEEELRETAERLSLALEAGQFDTWDWDVQTDTLIWTEAAEKRLGPAPSTLGGFLEKIHPDDRQMVAEAVRRSLEERAPYDVEYRTKDASGNERWLYVRGEAFHDKEGRPMRMLGVDVDVTDRKNQEVFEQDFVANVAHDMKNPLAAVKAQTQLLRRRIKTGKADLETVDSVLGVLDSGLSRMNRRIEELADVARLRAGQSLELRVDRCNLRTLVHGIIEVYQQASERHEFVVDDGDDELAGVWDTGRIERVVDNLITNAIKYSPDGGVIDVRLARIENGISWAALTVTDQGIGIPEADLPHIFERYWRAVNTAVITGTGIGLSGARQIVEQHGGRVTVESSELAGSKFTVHLPLQVTNG